MKQQVLATLMTLFLMMTAHAAGRDALPVLKVTDRMIVTPVGSSLSKDQNVLIIRVNPDDDEPDVVANGKVATIKDKFAYVRLDLESIKKRPLTTDKVVLLGEPKIFKVREDQGKASQFSQEFIPPEKNERGYISLRYLHIADSLESESSTQANSLKQLASFPRSGWELEWFLDFLSNYGFSYGQSNGSIPIESYYRKDVQASYTQDYFKLMYRTEKKYDLRAHLYLQSNDELFETQNPDEYVVGTKLSSTLLGASFFYEPGDLLLKSNSFAMQLSYLKFQYGLSISGTAADQKISRGSSGTVAITEMKLGIGATMWIPWVPWVHRYTIDVEGFQRTTDLKFSGTTRSESGGYVIPENGAYSEKQNGFMLMIGVRFEDVVGAVFKPKD